MNYRTDDWDGQDFEMYALTFKVADIHAAYRQLKANGVKVDEVIFTNPGSGYNFKFYDLDGNKFDVWGGFPEGWTFEASKPDTHSVEVG